MMRVVFPEEYYDKWFDQQAGKWKDDTPQEVLDLRDECIRNKKRIEEEHNIAID